MALDGSSHLVTSASVPLNTNPGGVDLNNRHSFEDFYDVAESEEADDPEESWKPNMNENESIKLLRAENKKLRQELEASENQLAEYQAAMPPIYDELESKTSEIQYLRDTLESSEKKYEILHERQKKLELKMTWTDQDMQEQLNLISDETSAEVEGIKERLFKELNRLKKELSTESHERDVLVNDLVMVKQQLSKLRKAKDDEREAYILNSAELERASRNANREKHKLRITVEDMREHIFGLESELEKQKEIVAEKEQLLQTREEELFNKSRKNSAAEKRPSCSATILHDNLAVELSHNENVITQIRQEKMNAEDDLAEFKEQLESTLELVENAYNNISPDSASEEGKLLLGKAIAQTREFLGLSPLPEEAGQKNRDEDSRESIDELNFDDKALILERNEIGTGLDEVDILTLSTEENASEISYEEPEEPKESPKVDQMEEFKVEVVKEVTKMKQILLKEFQQLAQEHLRSSVVEETIMDTIQNSTQSSTKAVIDWMEKDRRSVAQAQELESSTELERLKMAFQASLEDQQKKSGVIVEKLRKKMADLELALKNSEVEVETLRKHRQKDAAEKLQLKSQIRNNKVDELKVGALVWEILPNPFFEEDEGQRVHRLNTLAGVSINIQRACVTKFLQTYSKPSEWKTVQDYQLHTTTYIFDFDGTMWKTRISFLYPFVNYMTQVIGVNKKNLGSLFVILPTSTVTMKISRLSNSFCKILETLLTHNSDGLWNYIYIFLDNVSTHYGNIKRYVGTRTRTIKQREDRRRLVFSTGPSTYPRSMTDSVLRTTSMPIWEEDNKNSGYASARFVSEDDRPIARSLFLEKGSSGRKLCNYPLKAVF